MKILFASILLVTWAPSPSGPAPTGYKLCVNNVCVDAGKVLQKQTPDLDLSKPHDITVRAYNQYGESPPSAVVTVGKPSAPAITGTELMPGQ